MQLPKEGISKASIFENLREFKSNDIQWQSGKSFSLVFNPGEYSLQLTKEAYLAYFSENALNPNAFPSLKKMEKEVVRMTAHLLNGGETAAGCMTSGGTESIFVGIYSALNWARQEARFKNKSHLEIVVPVSAHPAFQKACFYLGVKCTTVPVKKDGRVDVEALKKTISDHTFMIVGSSPSYPHGVVDPLSELSQLALQKDLWLHVDACVGGFFIPFAEKAGYPMPVFDFRLAGVRSISVDLHKYGYCAKGASVIIYSNADWRRYQFFVYTEWPGGIYASAGALGTRPGGAIAAAWATLMHNGELGYTQMARNTMKTTARIRQAIEEIEELKVIGDPDICLLAFGSDQLNIYEVGDELSLKGWHIDRQQNPPCLHLTITQIHQQIAGEFIQNLGEATEKVKKLNWHTLANKIQVGAVSKAQKVLPKPVFDKLRTMSSKKNSLGKKRTAAMYGMMGSLANNGNDLHEMVVDFMDKLYS